MSNTLKIDKQLIEIVEKLQAWSEERHLTLEQQRAGLIPNLLEELLEFMRAETDDDRIDALCDIAAFSINSCQLDEVYLHSTTNWLNNISKENFFTINTEGQYVEQIADKILFYIQEVQRRSLISNNYDDLQFLTDIALFSIKLLGYNPCECMLETIKEISSRRGTYNEAIGKWVKDTSPEAQELWYKANYKSCKEKDFRVDEFLINLLGELVVHNRFTENTDDRLAFDDIKDDMFRYSISFYREIDIINKISDYEKIKVCEKNIGKYLFNFYFMKPILDDFISVDYFKSVCEEIICLAIIKKEG